MSECKLIFHLFKFVVQYVSINDCLRQKIRNKKTVLTWITRNKKEKRNVGFIELRVINLHDVFKMNRK